MAARAIQQGDIWWADLPDPVGSGPGYRRPLLIVQRDSVNRSRVRTVVGVVLTSNLNLERAPGNVFLPAIETGLSKDSIANVSQIITVDKALLDEYVAMVPPHLLDDVLDGVQFIIGR